MFNEQAFETYSLNIELFLFLGCGSVSQSIKYNFGNSIMLNNARFSRIVSGSFYFGWLWDWPFIIVVCLQKVKSDHWLIENNLAVIRTINECLCKWNLSA